MGCYDAKMANRLRFIDGLRGLAALLVVAAHADNRFEVGRHGVSIFFVISGFIICYSLRNTPATWIDSLRFIGRRIVRLDPPYWALIATTQLLARPSVSAGSLLAHAFYVQSFVGYSHIVTVFWTLCIEVQFYLTFLIIRAVATWLRLPLALVALPLFVASLVNMRYPESFEAAVGSCNALTCLIPFYASFYLGILACNFFVSRSPSDRFTLFGALAASSLRLGVQFDDWLAVSIVTAIGIYAASLGNGMRHWLADPISQFFGRISYSLYLWHLLVISTVTFRTGSQLLAVSAAIFFSALMYLMIERPSVLMAKRAFASYAAKSD